MTRNAGSRYGFSPLFVVRVAGVPFEALDRLATPESMAGARSLRAAEDELGTAAEAALAALRRAASQLAAKPLERARRALGQRLKVPKDAAALTPEVSRYVELFAAVESKRTELAATLDRELAGAARALADSAAGPLRRFSVFAASASVNERLEASGREREARGWRERAADRLQLNYLQRVAAKNDTVSEFGPTGWGTYDPQLRGMTLAPVPGIARRDVFLEKWVTTELAAAMTLDPDARLEALPRVDPRARLSGDRVIREDTAFDRTLSDDERALLAKLDGRTPARELAPLDLLERLASDGIVAWRFEAPVLDAHRAHVLREDVRAWRDGPARAKWLPILDRMLAAESSFAEADVDGRRAALEVVEAELDALGRSGKERGRTLYAATNAIGEDCVRECGLALGGDLAARFTQEASPWLALFCDTAAHAWQRVTTRCAELYRSAPRRDGEVSLLAFLRHAEQSGTPLGGDGIARLANGALREVQAAFEEHLEGRADAPEIELTEEDCQLVRRKFSPPPAPLLPGVDLQIAAGSVQAVIDGDYELVIGEVNGLCPTFAHVFFWGCPDPRALSRELRELVGVSRACHVEIRTLDRGNHVAFHWPEVFGADWTGIVTDRVGPGRRWLAPADARIVERDGELRVLGPGDDDRGALLNVWDMPFQLGVHPFLFRRQRGRHLSRLRSGRTILQRRVWIVGADELAGGAHSGTSPALLVAVDRLRGARDLPRHVFVRPTDRVLPERVAASGRDKDVKPFYVDLESYLFCEAFHHRLAKYGELEVTEMLPAPEHLPWREPDGRRTFEMRITCRKL